METVDIVLIYDRSGSMVTIQQEAEGAVNGFVDEQKQAEGSAVISAYQFDTVYEHVFGPVDIQSAPKIKITPRGFTALLDSIGRTVVEYRPVGVKTIFVILTDGLENRSVEWTLEAVNEAITDSKSHGNDFVFLGANQDAIQVGNSLGIATGSSLTFAANKQGVDNGMRAVSNYLTASRSGMTYDFSDAERDAASGLTDEA
jgi:hypothetical protein